MLKSQKSAICDLLVFSIFVLFRRISFSMFIICTVGADMHGMCQTAQRNFEIEYFIGICLCNLSPKPEIGNPRRGGTEKGVRFRHVVFALCIYIYIIWRLGRSESGLVGNWVVSAITIARTTHCQPPFAETTQLPSRPNSASQ